MDESKEETIGFDETPVRASETGAAAESGSAQGQARVWFRPQFRSTRQAAGPAAVLAAGHGSPGGFSESSSVARRGASSAPRRSMRISSRRCSSAVQGFVAERARLCLRRLTGVCTTHQRRLTRAIKQARNIALLPFATRH